MKLFENASWLWKSGYENAENVYIDFYEAFEIEAPAQNYTMHISADANYVVYVNDFATPDCMKQRNQYMVDHSSACIAYRDPAVWKSGTAQIVRMAEKSGLEIINTFTILRGK